MTQIRVGTRWTARGSQAFARTRANAGWLVQHADSFRVVCSDPGGEKPDKAFDRHYFLATFEPVEEPQSEYVPETRAEMRRNMLAALKRDVQARQASDRGIAELVAENRKLRLDLEATQTRPLTVDLQRVQAERETLRDEVGSLRAALAETQQRCDEASLARETQETVASLERLRASRSRDLEQQVDDLKRDVKEQVKLRQEAQDQFVEEARRRKQAEEALRLACGSASMGSIERETRARKYAEEQCASRTQERDAARQALANLQQSHDALTSERKGKVERQRGEIVRLSKEVEWLGTVVEAWKRTTTAAEGKVAQATAESRARAEVAERERDSVRAELQRLTSVVTFDKAEVARLQGVLATAGKERDRAHECIRRVKCLVAFTRDPFGALVSVRALVERYS